MSVIDAFTGELAEGERKRKLQQLADSAAKIGAMYGLTIEEVNAALLEYVKKKRLRRAELDCAEMRAGGVTQ